MPIIWENFVNFWKCFESRTSCNYTPREKHYCAQNGDLYRTPCKNIFLGRTWIKMFSVVLSVIPKLLVVPHVKGTRIFNVFLSQTNVFTCQRKFRFQMPIHEIQSELPSSSFFLNSDHCFINYMYASYPIVSNNSVFLSVWLMSFICKEMLY